MNQSTKTIQISSQDLKKWAHEIENTLYVLKSAKDYLKRGEIKGEDVFDSGINKLNSMRDEIEHRFAETPKTGGGNA